MHARASFALVFLLCCACSSFADVTIGMKYTNSWRVVRWEYSNREDCSGVYVHVSSWQWPESTSYVYPGFEKAIVDINLIIATMTLEEDVEVNGCWRLTCTSRDMVHQQVTKLLGIGTKFRSITTVVGLNHIFVPKGHFATIYGFYPPVDRNMSELSQWVHTGSNATRVFVGCRKKKVVLYPFDRMAVCDSANALILINVELQDSGMYTSSIRGKTISWNVTVVDEPIQKVMLNVTNKPYRPVPYFPIRSIPPKYKKWFKKNEL